MGKQWQTWKGNSLAQPSAGTLSRGQGPGRPYHGGVLTLDARAYIYLEARQLESQVLETEL